MAIFYLWISPFAFHQRLLASVMANAPQVNVTEESLTRQATFIFKGTVVKLNIKVQGGCNEKQMGHERIHWLFGLAGWPHSRLRG